MPRRYKTFFQMHRNRWWLGFGPADPIVEITTLSKYTAKFSWDRNLVCAHRRQILESATKRKIDYRFD